MAPVSRKKQAKPKIPVSEIARIRAWTKYGMTVSEVAEVCGVAAGEIERILRQAGLSALLGHRYPVS